METSILRKPLHILLVLAMTASLLATAAVGSFAQTFEGLPPDVDPDGPFAEAVEWAVAEDLTRPFPDGEFKGTRDITRAALATWYYRLAGEPEGPFEEPAAIDVDEDTNFYTEISWALENGVMNVFPDGNFNPNRATVRQAAAAITFQNAGSPEGEFAQLAIDEFPDVDENTTFANEIGWLVANGYTEAFDDGEWKPNRDVSRFAMAAWFFRIYGPEAPVDTLRVVAAETEDDLVYLSDGAAVTKYEYTGDSFEIDGTASSIGAFEAFLGNAPDVLIESRVEGDDVIHNVFSGELVLSGVLGNGDATDLAIVDFPSGVALTDITDEIVGADRNFFTVDGDAAVAATFDANVGIGDFIEVEVLEVGEEPDFSDFIFRHNLTNGELTGTVAALLNEEGTTLVVDAVAGDDADVTTFPTTPHYTFDLASESDTIVYLVDGEDNDGDAWTLTEWLDEAEIDAAVSYSRAAGVETFDVASTEPEAPVQTVYEGVVIGDGDLETPLNSGASEGAALLDVRLLVEGDDGLELTDPIDIVVTDDNSILVDGRQSLVTELEDAISVGDTIVYGVGDADFDAFVELTNGTVEDAQIVAWDAPVLTARLAGTTVEVDVDATQFVFGFGNVDPEYTVNGLSEIEATDETMVAVDAGVVVYLLNTTNLVTTPLTISLVDDDGTPVWALEGFTEAQLTAAADWSLD